MKIIVSLGLGILSAWLISGYLEHRPPPLPLTILLIPVYLLTLGIFGHGDANGEIFVRFALGIEIGLILYCILRLLGGKLQGVKDKEQGRGPK